MQKITLGAFLYSVGMIEAVDIQSVNNIKLPKEGFIQVFQNEIKPSKMGLFKFMFSKLVTFSISASYDDNEYFIRIVYSTDEKEISSTIMAFDEDFNRVA